MTAILVTGFERQARYLAALLNANVSTARATVYGDRRTPLVLAAARALRCDAAVNFGGPEPKALLRAICEARGRPTIHIWAGTDVLKIAHSPGHVERLQLLGIIHWAVSPQLVCELAEIGIDARCVTLASAQVPQVLPALPKQFAILTYLPQPSRDFYGQRAIFEAARAMPDVRFTAIGRGSPEAAAPSNVEYVGEVSNIEQYIDAASVLVRMTQHDGLSQNVVEALARGRHVIWTYPYPGVLQACSQHELIEQLQQLRRTHESGELTVNHAGAQYAAAHHNPATIAGALFGDIVREIERVRSAASQTHAKTIAISGAPAFSARIALNWRSYNGDVVPKLLSTHTNSDMVLSIVTLLRSQSWYSIGEPTAPRILEFAAVALRKRRIVHWLGNDVQALAEHSERVRRYRGARYVHLAQNAEVARGLSRLGLHAAVASLPALARAQPVAPLPERFTLLLYLPPSHSQLYGRHQYERLMRVMLEENVRYIIVGGGEIEIPSGVSAEQLGWVHDLHPLYERATALVRFTQTDSLSAMVIEALLHGRYVLWSNEFPHTTHIRDFHDLEGAVRSLLSLHRSAALRPQYDAAATMSTLYAPEASIKNFTAACAGA